MNRDQLTDLLSRFISKVNKTESCWLWNGGKDAYGYGRIKVNKKLYRAHRISLVFEGIKLNPDLVVDHICKVRNCVNPKHLRLVSKSFNVLENSDGLAAQNRKKTTCPKGHPYDIFQKEKDGTKRRRCSICYKQYHKRYCEKNPRRLRS